MPDTFWMALCGDSMVLPIYSKLENMVAQLEEANRDKDSTILTLKAEVDSLRTAIQEFRRNELKSPRDRKVNILSPADHDGSQ